MLKKNWNQLDPFNNVLYGYFFRPVIRRSLVCLAAAGYTQFFLTLNRSLPVVIAVFRYIHIFHWTMVVSEEQKMNIKN